MGEVGLGSLHVLGLAEVGRADGLLHQDAFTNFLEDAVLNIFVNTFVHAQVVQTGKKLYVNMLIILKKKSNLIGIIFEKWLKLGHLVVN